MADDPTIPPAQETFSREYVSELRGENATYRTKAKDEAAARAAAEEKVANAEKLANDKITAAESKANERIIRSELKAAALKAGMVDLDGLKLADLSKVKLDDNGEIEGADALMEALKTAKPYLFAEASSTSSTTKVPPKVEPERKNAKEMTDEEYSADKKKHGFK